MGHDQGSQVTDFRMPEWKDVLEKHLNVWDRIFRTAREENRERLTVTPEFGPAPYMLVSPGTDAPLADQWGMNVTMMELLTERWRDIDPAIVRKGQSADYLKRSGQVHDLEFVIHHIDDLYLFPDHRDAMVVCNPVYPG